MQKVAKEAFRVLKKGKMCAVMIGDVRKYGKSSAARLSCDGMFFTCRFYK